MQQARMQFLLDAWTSRHVEGGWGNLSALGGGWLGHGWAKSGQQAALHYAPVLGTLWLHTGQRIVSLASCTLKM